MNEKDNKSLTETKLTIQKAKEKLDKISEDEHERYLADLREKYIRDQYAIEAYGYDRGIAEGIAENKKEIARKMLTKNVNINLIIEFTGLSKEEIEKL